MTRQNIIGREYLRVSRDRQKEGRSPDQQHDANVPCAASFGVELGVPYRDLDRSASRYATKARESFDQLIADLQADTFDAEVLVLWESSRGSRKVSEWVELLELLEKREVRVLVTTHARMYDPKNHRDRRTLLEDAVDAEYESAKTNERIRRDVAASAAKGHPHGICPFGYIREYHPQTRRFVRQYEHPEEGPVVRELFKRLEKGDYLYAIERDFAKRGFTTRKGKRLTAVNLRSLAENVSYAGYRVHDPERWVQHKHTPTPTGQRIKAVWPAIVPYRQWLAVQEIINNPTRRTNGDGRTRHLMSMILKCDLCGGPMTHSNGLGTGARSARGVLDPHYRCQLGHTRIAQAPIDELGTKMVYSFIEHPDHYKNLLANKTDSKELDGVRDQLAEARAEHNALAEANISVTLAAKKEPAILARIQKLESRERELSTPAELAAILDPLGEITSQWEDFSIVVKRKLLKTLLSAEYFGEIRVRRTDKRGRGVQGPVTERLILRRTRKGRTTDILMTKLKIVE